MIRCTSSLLLVTVAFVGSGCFVDSESPLPEDFGICEADAPEEDVSEVPEAPNYYEHVKPILDARCIGCHQEGGIGPFSLTDYDSALRFRNSVRTAVATGIMPPWQPDDCCSEYRWDLSLTEVQKETILRWADQGGLPGAPENEGEPLEVDNGGLSRVDVTLTMEEPFEPMPVIGADEVRCFLLDWPLDRDVFVTGMNVVPGDRSMVHHVVVYAFDAADADALRQKDSEDDRPGWNCKGQNAGEAQPVSSLGGWTPGVRGVEYPDGLGRKVAKDSVIVLNMHYDTGRGIRTDQSSVELMIADNIEHQIKSVGIINPMWLIGEGMSIAKDDPDASYFFHYDPMPVFSKGKPFRIYSVNHHMHELGSIGRMAILRADGSTECLLNITDWDFDWLGEYWFKEPIMFYPGDELYIECHWDNRAANQKFVNGEQLEPRDLAWGTDDEMCAGVLNVVVEGN